MIVYLLMTVARSAPPRRPIQLHAGDESHRFTPAILQAKLQQPRQLPGTVARPRLWAQLDRGAQAAVTLVSAPAGFGKTTVVSSWLNRRANHGEQSAPSVWMSLDRGDSDLTVFLRYLCAALESEFPGSSLDLLAILNSAITPPLSTVATVVSNVINDLPADVILVVDDFHVIEGTAVPNLLALLTRHWPAPLHLVLISRHMPDLPLATLRAKRQLYELEADALRFNPTEVREYLQWVTDTEPPPPIIDHYANETEGWIAGLHLAALSLKRTGNLESPVHAHHEANANLAAYVIEDVLAQEDPSILSFLLTVSFLDRLCLPLCELLADPLPGKLSARECLGWLVDSNFLIVPLDEEGTWYRLHRLLEDALRQYAGRQLGEDHMTALRRRAAGWFEQHGMIEEALRQAVALGDLDRMARLVEAGFVDTVNRDDRPTLERWLALFPESFVAQRPGLLVLKAVVLQVTWQLPRVRQTLDAYDALIAREPDAPTTLDRAALRGTVCTLRAQLAFFATEMAASEACARQALDLLPTTWHYYRGGAFVFLALALQALGRFAEAEAAVHAEYLPLASQPNTYTLRLMLALVSSGVNEGHLESAYRYASLMFEKAGEAPYFLMRGWACYWKGVIELEWGWSATARTTFATLADPRLTTNAHAVRNGLIGLALLQAEHGDHRDAADTLAMVSHHDVTVQGVESREVGALRAWLAAMQGDLSAALRWADSWDDPLRKHALVWMVDPHLIQAHLLIRRGRPADLTKASALLDALEQIAAETRCVRYQVHIGVAHALCRDAAGDMTGALNALNEAVRLAEPGGFLRAFIEPGPRLRELLTLIARAEPDNSAVYGLLRNIAHTSAQRTRGPAQSVRQPLAEPLTPREMDVLRLMRERRSDKEIAATLGISVGTVKRHSANLFAKLNVNRRWEAVVRAEELAIL